MPQRFYVELKTGPDLARRKLDDNAKTMVVAHGSNFLDTDPSGIYDFSPNEVPVVIKIAVTAIDAGYYETCVRTS